ncbi:hypothetical protein [Jannaschia rubra]|uniref:hypothetical protein n=1 Tax=Jannaschia rubra TaxID=282197 RepID=UPI002492A5D9|nr:hypothetical protein [Jannaschia rubra]
MSRCIDLPYFGATCASDLIVRVGDARISLLDPSLLAAVILVTAICVFVFRSPA